MTKTLQAVIFDMDGVIVDTFELHYSANKEVAGQLSLPFSIQDNEKTRGLSRMDIIEMLVKESGTNLTAVEKEKLSEDKNKHYQQQIASIDENAILPGMKDFISSLKERGIKIAVASSSTNGKTVLENVGLLDCFDYVVDPSTLAKGKPDPEIFRKAADALGVAHENIAAIEDGAAGIEAINETEMFSIGVGQAVKNKTADWHVSSTDEITLHKLLERFR